MNQPNRWSFQNTNHSQLCWQTILLKKSVRLAHHDFRFKWKKQMQNEYPHDISINLFIKLLILLNYGGIFGLRSKYIMWVLILHLFFPIKTKIMVFSFGHFSRIYLPEISQWQGCAIILKSNKISRLKSQYPQSIEIEEVLILGKWKTTYWYWNWDCKITFGSIVIELKLQIIFGSIGIDIGIVPRKSQNYCNILLNPML